MRTSVGALPALGRAIRRMGLLAVPRDVCFGHTAPIRIRQTYAPLRTQATAGRKHHDDGQNAMTSCAGRVGRGECSSEFDVQH